MPRSSWANTKKVNDTFVDFLSHFGLFGVLFCHIGLLIVLFCGPLGGVQLSAQTTKERCVERRGAGAQSSQGCSSASDSLTEFLLAPGDLGRGEMWS